MPELYSVYGIVTPGGVAEETNTCANRTVREIDRMFNDHLQYRWLIVRQAGGTEYRIIDLWQFEMMSDYPYKRQYFVDVRFETVSQAIGYIVLILN